MSYIVDKLLIVDIKRSSIPKDVAELFEKRTRWADQVYYEQICFIQGIHITLWFDLLNEYSQSIVLEIQKEVAESGASYIRLIN
jgi:hypothetical protein